MLKQQVRGGQGNRSLHPCAGVNRTALLVAQQGRSDGAKKNGMTTHDSTAAPQLSAPSTCTLKIHHCPHSRIGPNQQILGLLDEGTFALQLRLWFLELVAPSDTPDAD